jgi:hypothetical protein
VQRLGSRCKLKIISQIKFEIYLLGIQADNINLDERMSKKA